MSSTIDRSRRLFSLLKIGRGQTVTIATGDDSFCLWVHWTDEGPRLCYRKNLKAASCWRCGPNKPGARQVIYLAAQEQHHDRTKLLILSAHAIGWTDEVTDLRRRTLTIERAAKNNLIRARDDGPNRWHVPADNLPSWIATLLKTDRQTIEETR